jgi:hypothetical protein
MFKSMDSSQIAYFIIFIISIVGIIAINVNNKNKGGVKRIVDKIGDIIAAVLLMPITVIQIALQICIDAVTIVLAVITGVCTIVINVIRLIKHVIDASHEQGKFTGMCGELASDPVATMILLGLYLPGVLLR